MRTKLLLGLFIPLWLVVLPLSGCTGVSPASQGNGKLNVVATTTIVGDVVRNVGGSAIQLSVLIPPNVDEHGYQPTPQDAVKIAQANLVFENGAGLEQFMSKLMSNAGPNTRLIAVSDGIPLIQNPADAEEPASGSTTSGDPHVWMDPNNVLVWVDAIQKALSAADPPHAADYQKNADQYRQQLKDLDTWIRAQIVQVPESRRDLVTDHLVFTYFAKQYNFKQIGAIVPGYSTMAEPSAQQLAALEDEIRKLNVPVIFVGNTVNPALAERVASDTGTKLVHFLTGSLTGASGPGPTYIQYMQYNVTTVIDALK